MSAEPSQHGAKGTADLLARFGLHPDKSLGQHFLVDPNQIDRIVRLARVKPGDHVAEVGPGLGALTAGLVSAGCTVVAVEVDEGLVEALRAQFGTNDAVRVVHEDALKVDWDQVTPADKSWAMVANLPYNVATPLVLDVLDDVPQITSLLVMVQREVAERLVAGPGSWPARARGRRRYAAPRPPRGRAARRRQRAQGRRQIGRASCRERV